MLRLFLPSKIFVRVNAAIKRVQSQMNLNYAEREQYRTIYCAKVQHFMHNALCFILFLFYNCTLGSRVHCRVLLFYYDFIVVHDFFRYLLLAISELMRIFAAEYKQLKL